MLRYANDDIRTPIEQNIISFSLINHTLRVYLTKYGNTFAQPHYSLEVGQEWGSTRSFCVGAHGRSLRRKHLGIIHNNNDSC